MSFLQEYKLVFSMLLKNQYAFLRKKSTDSPYSAEFSLDKPRFGSKKTRTKEENKKIAQTVGFIFLDLYLLFILISGTVSIAGTIIAENLTVEFITILMGITQFIVLFFGLFSSVSVLFYSKDAELLSSLPISNKSVFLARFSMIYLNELLIAFLMSVPILLCFGITASVMGVVLSPAYWILIPLMVLLPVLPLLLICLLILPMFYIITFFKQRKQLSGIFTGIIFALIIGFYFAIYYVAMKSGNAMGENGFILSAGFIKSIKTISLVLYPDLVLARSMMGIKVYLNLPIFFVILIGAGALAVIFANVFYPKAKTSAYEHSGNISVNSSKNISMQKESFKRTFIIKEFKTWRRESNLMLGTLLTIFMAPAMILILSFVAFAPIGAEGGIRTEFLKLGTGMMMGAILTASNYASLIAFSYEGKKIYILKTLPIDTDELVKCKIAFADCITYAGAFFVSVAFCIALYKYFWVGILAFPIISLLGIANNRINIYRDMKNPKLDWQNISELTQNNTRFLLPTFINLGLGMLTMAIAIIIMSLDVTGKVISTPLGLIIVLACSLIEGLILLLVSTNNRKINTKELLAKM